MPSLRASFPFLQLFLTEGALYVLVVDLYKFSRYGDDVSSWRGDSLYIWLDALLCRVPGCAVLVIATHADEFPQNEQREQVQVALSRLRNAIRDHLETKRVEWEADQLVMLQKQMGIGGPHDKSSRKACVNSSAPQLEVCGVIEASGCSSKDILMVRHEICRLAGNEGVGSNGVRLFPNVGQSVPVSWARAWAVMDALRLGADIVEAARLSDSRQPRATAAEGISKQSFVTWEAALEYWSTTVHSLGLETEVGEGPEHEARVLKVSACW